MNTGEIRYSKSYITKADSLKCDECSRNIFKGDSGIFIVRDIQIAPDKRPMLGFICNGCFGDRKLDEDRT